MIQKLLLFLTVSVWLLLPSTAFALRCGSKIVEVGDLKFEVLLACGEPHAKEVIGHIDQRRYTVADDDIELASNKAGKEIIERVRVMVIEEWIIKKKKDYYSLIFEGNILKKIEWID